MANINEPLLLKVLRDAGLHDSPWGFVVFRTTYKDCTPECWAKFRQRWDALVTSPLAKCAGNPEMEAAQKRLKFQWVEDVSLENADGNTLRDRYRSMKVEPGLDHSVLLAVNSASLLSVLDDTLQPDVRPTHVRFPPEKAPFALAVHNYDPAILEDPDHGEDDELYPDYPDFSGEFKVAVEAIAAELFPCLATQIYFPDMLGGPLKEDEIWFRLRLY